jgi:hypothetical protein
LPVLEGAGKERREVLRPHERLTMNLLLAAKVAELGEELTQP